MPVMAPWPALFISACVLLLAGCREDARRPPFVQRDGVDGLVAWIRESQALCNAREHVAGKQLAVSAVPLRADLRRVLRPEVAPDVVDRLVALLSEVPVADHKISCMFTPGLGRTAIHVHGATTEQLAVGTAADPGTTGSVPIEAKEALGEFPRGARQIAAAALAPRTTFYEVEVTAPGKESGTKFHMFYWDGKRWRWLGPLWRAFRP